MSMQVEDYHVFRFRFAAVEDLAFHFDVPMPSEATEGEAKEKLRRVLAQYQADLEASIYHRDVPH
jgi:hypothetical protein